MVGSRRAQYFADLRSMTATIDALDELVMALRTSGLMNDHKYRGFRQGIKDARASHSRLVDMVYQDVPAPN